jgi:hypothetical protein
MRRHPAFAAFSCLVLIYAERERESTLGMVAHAYNPRYSGGRDKIWRIAFQGQPEKNVHMTPS